VYCRNTIIRNVAVNTEGGANTDGCNPDSWSNVLIEGCFFSTGDDCIAINSGLGEDGVRVGRPCENILIRNCRMEEGHGGVVIGSGMSGGVRNVYAHDCSFTGTATGIRLKTMRGRGGVVENVWFENITMSAIECDAIRLNMFYGCITVEPKSDNQPVFRNITVKNVRCDGAETGIFLRGLPESKLQNITLEQVSVTANKGMVCSNVDGLRMNDVGVEATENAQ